MFVAISVHFIYCFLVCFFLISVLYIYIYIYIYIYSVSCTDSSNLGDVCEQAIHSVNSVKPLKGRYMYLGIPFLTTPEVTVLYVKYK